MLNSLFQFSLLSPQLKLSFDLKEPEEFEYQSEQSLLADYRDAGADDEEEEEEKTEDDERHSSVSEDEDVGPKPSGFKDNVLKGTGGKFVLILLGFSKTYLDNLVEFVVLIRLTTKVRNCHRYRGFSFFKVNLILRGLFLRITNVHHFREKI